jgi:hypothetical protein
MDDRTTSNPALMPVDFATATDIVLAGLQFIGAHQLQAGELVLVAGQTNAAQNGIYKVSAGVWTLQGYDNARQNYIDASSIDTSWSDGALYLIQLGIYKGALYVARGAYAGQLFQIDFVDPAALVGVGAVSAASVAPTTVNRIDFWTGVYQAGTTDTRVTEENGVRTPQQVGAAPGSGNEIPGFNIIVPGAVKSYGQTLTEAPYGCATRQGLPPGFDTLPYSGSLWVNLENNSIGVWLNNDARGVVWINALNVPVSFESSGFWPNPGPGSPSRPIRFQIDYSDWTNQYGYVDYWNNVLNEEVFWSERGPFAVLPPGGDTLFINDDGNLVLWHNVSGDNVDFAEIYRNAVPPNKSGPWPYGWNV